MLRNLSLGRSGKESLNTREFTFNLHWQDSPQYVAGPIKMPARNCVVAGAPGLVTILELWRRLPPPGSSRDVAGPGGRYEYAGADYD
jgi:hypothetical protein